MRVRSIDIDYATPAADPISEPRIGRSVSLDHAAQMLGVSRRTIYNRIRDGRLQTIRTVGGSQRVLLDSVKGWRMLPSDRREPV
jgi:excisionase family DNA binding protein